MRAVKSLVIKNRKISAISAIPVLTAAELRAFAIDGCKGGQRAVCAFGVPDADQVRLIWVLADDSEHELYVASCLVARDGSWRSVASEAPQWHLFERELWEDHGLEPVGHPWLKPVRMAHDAPIKRSFADYPFFTQTGEEVHEVAVGPVHAGVIEPGHFRFMCDGERVNHLEIALGYQHRGVLRLMERGDLRGKAVLAESVSGDAAVAHATAYAGLVEALCGVSLPARAGLIRGLALELERAAIHLGDLSALCNDIGYLPGTQMLGAMRTVIINTTQSLCGNRFGKGLVRPGGVLFDIDQALREKIVCNVTKIRDDEQVLARSIFDNQSVLARFEKTGTVSEQTARDIGLVGPAGRASGLACDTRKSHPFDAFAAHPVHDTVRLSGFAGAAHSGDVFARAHIRHREIQNSLSYVLEIAQALESVQAGISVDVTQEPAADSFAISLVEGWRGEVVHAAVTHGDRSTFRYVIVDPSFHNWFGLALAVRDNGVSDFPLCNKSFNLSYCGFDL